MSGKKAQIQFHRRSRYEDILELVNDNEEALKPFPNRDAVFYKASNKGSYFDGKDHLDRLKAEQKRINERIVRDHMLREYATDNDLTHRALWDAGAEGSTETPRSPEMYNIGTPIEQFDNMEVDEQAYLQTAGALASAEQASQSNRQQLAVAHQQQIEQEQQQSEGVLRSLGSGALRVGGNIAGNVAQGMDLSTASVAGVSQEALQALAGAIMRRFSPQEVSSSDPIPNMQYLQPHQPNVGATQQALPPYNPNAPAERRSTAARSFARAQSPEKKARAKEPAPRPNVTIGGSSSSSSAPALPPLQPTVDDEQPASPIRRVKKESVKKGSGQPERETLTLPTPDKIGITKLKKFIDEANERETITKSTYKNFTTTYNRRVKALSSGDKMLAEQLLLELKDMYRKRIFNK